MFSISSVYPFIRKLIFYNVLILSGLASSLRSSQCRHCERSEAIQNLFNDYPSNTPEDYRLFCDTQRTRNTFCGAGNLRWNKRNFLHYRKALLISFFNV